MAYVKLSEIACVDRAEHFCRLRDFLCKRDGTYDYSATGIGWTLLDSGYVVDEDNPQQTDWFVVTSIGESGKERLCYRFDWAATTGIEVYGYQSWNATTHVGTNQYGYSNSFDISDTQALYNLIIYGNLDFFIILNKFIASDSTGNYKMFGAGKQTVLNGLDDSIVDSTGDLASGSGVTITTTQDLPSSWYVGRKIYCWDDTNIKIITILTLDAPTKTITADLSVSFSGNISLSSSQNYSVQRTTYIAQIFAYLIGDSGAINSTISPLIASADYIGNSFDPGSMNSEWWLDEIFYVQSNNLGGKLPFIRKIGDGATSGLSEQDSLFDGTNYFTYYKVLYNTYYVILEP